MKIGTLAFQQAINYGATLQIYALQKTVKELLPEGTTIEVINYIQPKLKKQYSTIRFSNNIVADLIKNVLLYRQRSLKKKNFSQFYKNHINLSGEYTSLKNIKNYNTIIVGSDQVWNSNIHDYDSNYLLDIPNNVKKISYAASIGKDELKQEDKNFFSKYLPSFSAISVRETNGIDLLSEYTDKEIKVSLDPTLLLSASEWKKVASSKKNKQKYILVYQLQYNDELEKLANEISRKLNLPLKYVMPPNKKSIKKISKEYSCGPDEFLNLIDNSEFVITNSFHGTCFSIIYNKLFFTVPHKTRGTRMVDLLKTLNLDERIVYNANELDEKQNLLYNQNYHEANKILDSLKKESLNYLIENL